MAKFPFMPVWWADYWLDASHLSDAEHGRYFLILKELWLAPGQRIPNDDEWLARKFRRSVDDIRTQIRPLLEEFCQCDGNRWCQNKLIEVYNKNAATSKKQSDRAKVRWDKGNIECHGTAAAMPLKLESERKKDKKDSAPSEQTPLAASPDLDALFYQRGKALLGRSAGGQLTKLRAAVGSVGAALQIIDDAQHKESPAEYVAGCIRSNGNGYDRHRRPSAIQSFYREHCGQGEPDSERPGPPLIEGRKAPGG